MQIKLRFKKNQNKHTEKALRKQNFPPLTYSSTPSFSESYSHWKKKVKLVDT